MRGLEIGTAGIHQEHDGRFEALGGVHRHHTDGVTLLLHLALDFGRLAVEHGDEGLQPGNAGFVVVEREAEKLVKHVADFRSEPTEIGGTPTLRSEYGGVEIMDRKLARQLAPMNDRLMEFCK